MKATIIGFMLAAILLAAAFVAPTFFPASVSPTAMDALKQAELARRQLHAYDAQLPLAAARGELERLKDADFGALADASSEEIEAMKSEFNRIVRSAQALDRESGLAASNIRPLSINPGSVSAFEKAVRDNHKQLSDAARNARQAAQAGRDSASNGQVAGAIKLIEAGDLLTESQLLRTRAVVETAHLQDVATAWAQARAENDHYAGLDVADIDDALTEEIEDLAARLEEAAGALETCRISLDERRKVVERTQARMKEKQDQLLQLSEAGFIHGDDASFQTYRGKYLSLSDALGELQARAHLLTYGGIEGGEEAGDGGEPDDQKGGRVVVGLNKLTHDAAMLEERIARLEKARSAVANKQAAVAKIGKEAGTRQDYFVDRLASLETDLNKTRDGLMVLLGQASEKEEAALQAARAAASAFKSAKSAADQWKNAASSLQRDKDPQRLNERLKMIAADTVTASSAASGEAQAILTTGRILAERALASTACLDALERAAELAPTFEFDAETLRENADQARDEAAETLTRARDAYEKLAQKQSGASWVHQSSLATVHHLLWRIDEFNADQHRGNLIDQLGQVVRGREQYPYLGQQATLYSSLTGGEPRQSVQPREEEVPEEPEEKPEDE